MSRALSTSLSDIRSTSSTIWFSMTAARLATVGWSNSAATGTSVPNTSRTRKITRVASSEWPPSSKKSSWAPTRSRPRTWAQIPASSSSTSPRGATYASPISGRPVPGAGSAARSSFPFGVSGRTVSSVKAAGIMNSGSRPVKNSRSSSAAGIPAADELREFLTGRLPEFMIPAAFTGLTVLPLTPNGKLDRAALPAPGTGRPETGDAYVAPRGEVEELLAGIWAQVLGLDRVGAQDDFFELGGHSLLATRVISRIQRVFGAEVPLAALFDHPTVASLAAVIDAMTPGPVAPPVVPVPRDGRLPLSFAQQRLWFLAQLEPGSTEYNVPVPVGMGAVDAAALGAALDAVTARHEVLRTRLAAGADGVPFQLIDPPSRFRLPVADVSGAADPVAAAGVLVAADAAAPFDLAAGPVIRACLARITGDEHVLVLSVHHVVSDERSGQILRRELNALYQAARSGEPDPLPPLGVQYADFAVWQRAWLTGEVLEGQLDYWRGQLAGAPVLDLPADRPRPPVRSASGAIANFTVPAEVAGGLRAVARQGGASMFMTVLAAYMVLLGRYTGMDDVVAGTPAANRDRAETEDLIGFFLNTLVMRADLSGDPSFTGLLGRVRAMALQAYAHQDVPFEQLVDELVTDRDRSRTPLFQVVVSYTAGGPGTDEMAAPQAGDREGPGADLGGPPVRTDLVVTVGEKPAGGLVAGIRYSTALFDAATIGRMAGHLGVLLTAVADDADVPLSGLPVLTAGERQQLVAGW